MRLFLFFMLGILSLQSYGLAPANTFVHEDRLLPKNPITQTDSTLKLTEVLKDSSQTEIVENPKQLENTTLEIIGDGRMNHHLYQHLYKDRLPNLRK